MPRVVVVSSDHDSVTQTLHSYAADFVASSKAGDALHFHNREDKSILDAVANREVKGIFVFLHGSKRPPGVINQNGHVIFGDGATEIFNGRIFCGTCYSLNAFGKVVAQNRGTVVGYKGELMVPFNNPKRANEMAKAVLAVHKTLRENGDAKRAADTARDEYRAIADRWTREGTIEGQVFAAFINMNSERIGVKGNVRSTL
jgi:hypothetical protein